MAGVGRPAFSLATSRLVKRACGKGARALDRLGGEGLVARLGLHRF